jgi:hypothetical protein
MLEQRADFAHWTWSEMLNDGKYFVCWQMVTRTKKIFVGGLSAPSTIDDVKGYFEQFGRVSPQLTETLQGHCSFCNILTCSQVEDAMLMFDKQTNRHRGKFSPPLQSSYSVDHVGRDGWPGFQVIQTLLLMFVEIWSRQWGADSRLSDLVFCVMFHFMFGGH